MHQAAVWSAEALKKFFLLEKIVSEHGISGWEERIDLTGAGEFEIIQTSRNGNRWLVWKFEVDQRGPGDMTARVRMALEFGNEHDCAAVGVGYDAERNVWMADHRRLEASPEASKMAGEFRAGLLAEPEAREFIQAMITVFQRCEGGQNQR